MQNLQLANGAPATPLSAIVLKADGLIYDADESRLLDFGQAASAVNYFKLYNSATGERLKLEAAGTDSNISVEFKTKGEANHVLHAENDTAVGVVVESIHTSTTPAASDVLYKHSAKGYNSADALTEYARAEVQAFSVTDGSEESTYAIKVMNGSGSLVQALMVGYDALQVGVSGSTAIIQPAGEDELELKTTGSNKDVVVSPHGTGLLKYGTHAAVTTETVSGYITIKDAGGTERKVAIVS